MSDYATVQDIIDLKRPLTAEEQVRANKLIPIVSSLIRIKAKSVGKTLTRWSQIPTMPTSSRA